MAIFCLADLAAGPEGAPGPHRRRLHRATSKPITRARPEGARRDGGAAEGRARAEPGADAGEQPGLHPRRAVRQHRARLQLGDRHPGGAEAGRLRGHRGRLRRRPGRREVHRHQVPQGRPAARCRGDRGHAARAQVPRRRGPEGPQQREPGRAGEGHGQPGAPRATTCATTTACPAWWRSTTSRADTEAELALLRAHMARQGVPVVVARHWAEGGAGAEELAHAVVAAGRVRHGRPALRLRRRRQRCGTR